MGGGDAAQVHHFGIVNLPGSKERICCVCTPESKTADGKRKYLEPFVSSVKRKRGK